MLYVVVDDVAFDAVADSDIVYYNDPAAAKKKEMYIVYILFSCKRYLFSLKKKKGR